jgi:hypothetical protein
MNRQMKRRNPPRGLVRSRLGGGGRSSALFGEMIMPTSGGTIRAAKQSPINMINPSVTRTHPSRDKGHCTCLYNTVRDHCFREISVVIRRTGCHSPANTGCNDFTQTFSRRRDVRIFTAGGATRPTMEATTAPTRTVTMGRSPHPQAGESARARQMLRQVPYLRLATGWRCVSQEKGPLKTAALRWEVSTSRGNDASGRNDRALPQMVSPSSTRYIPQCQADLHCTHSSRPKTATLHLSPRGTHTSIRRNSRGRLSL